MAMPTFQIVASGDEIFQLLEDGTIKRFTGTRENPRDWTQLGANDGVSQIAAGDSLYKAHVDGRIFVYDHGSWSEIYSNHDNKGYVTIIAAGPRLYLRDCTGLVHCYNGRRWDQVTKISSPVVQMAADGDSLYTYHKNKATYQWIEGGTKIHHSDDIIGIAAEGGRVYQLHRDGQIYQYIRGFWNRLDSGNSTVEIAAGSAGLYRRDSNGQVWGYLDGAWKLIDKGNKNLNIVVAK